MKAIIRFSIPAMLLIACARPLVRTASWEAPVGPPSIERLVDLGSLPLPETGAIDESAADGRFTPGEWMAIVGENLSADQAVVRVGDIPMEVKGYLVGGSLLVKVPAGLSARRGVELQVETSKGLAVHPLRISGYLVMSDTAADQVRFWPTPVAPEAQSVLFEEETVPVAMARPIGHVLSPDRGLLYVIGSGRAGYELKTIQMGAPEGPREETTIPFSSSGRPADLEISDAGDRLFLLTESELLVFDLGSPLLPVEAGRHTFATTGNPRYTSAAILKGGETVAALETLGGAVTLVDVSSPTAPAPISSTRIVPDATVPRAIGMVSDPRSPTGLFLLEGPNLQLTHVGLKQLVGKLFEDDPDVETDAPKGSRVLHLDVSSGTPETVSEQHLPRTFLPLFMFPHPEGGVMVSGVGPEVVSLSNVDSLTSGIRTAIEALKGAITIGHILRVDDTGQREIANGMSVFLTLDYDVVEKSLLYTAMKVGVRKFPPDIGVELGLHESRTGAVPRRGVALRTASWKTLVPPYRAPRISLQ